MEKVDDYTYRIPKQAPVILVAQEEHFYIIKIEDYILHPSDNFTLAANWNGGVVPVSKYMLVQMKKKMGKMLQFDGIGYNMETGEYKEDIYKGLWLPSGGIELIREVSRSEV